MEADSVLNATERREQDNPTDSVQGASGPQPQAPQLSPMSPAEGQERRERRRMGRLQATSEMIVAVAVCLTLMYVAKLVLVVMLISILLGFMLAPVVDILQNLKLPRALASLVAVLLLVLATYGLMYVSYNRAVDFVDQLPKYSGKIRHAVMRFKQRAETLQKSTENVLPSSDENDKNAVHIKQTTTWSDMVIGSFGSVTELIFTLSFIPFLTYFMLTWQQHVRSSTVMLFRMENRNTAYVTLGLIADMIRSFIVGNVLVGLFIGTLSTIAFGFMHLPYFYFVGFLSGFLSLVPYLGVLLATFPPLLTATGHLHSAEVIGIVVTVLVLHLFALNVLYPKFLGSRLQLNPLAVTLALLFWGWLWGAMGLILAIPLTAAIKIIFDHVESLRAYGVWLGE